jgi:hypothetical protein
MFSISEQVETKKYPFLMNTLDGILTEFAEDQTLCVKYFLSGNLIRSNLLKVSVSHEEAILIEEEFEKRGFSASIGMENGRTSLKLFNVWNCEDEEKYQSDPRILSAPEWRKKMKDYAFAWLISACYERAKSARNSANLLAFEIQLPRPQGCYLKFQCDDTIDHRGFIFKRPLFWLNQISCYDVHLNQNDDKRVVFNAQYKSPEAIVEARDWSNAILFSSLCFVKRVANREAQMWTYLPKEIVCEVMQYLLGAHASKFCENNNTDADEAV